MGGTRNHEHRHKLLKFGEMARKLGFIKEDDLCDALDIQKRRVDSGESHKLLGLILLELGHIDNEQLIQILREFEDNEKPPKKRMAV